MMRPAKIDTHHHILPPRFVEVWTNNKSISFGRSLPPWSPEASTQFMDRHAIQAAILSLGSQATSVGDDSAQMAAFTREMNSYMAGLCASHPGRFGFFASVPDLADSASCIEEIRYALDVLHADGVNLLTSYGSKYLGHPDFAPIWHELNQHSAVVFLHPGLDGMDQIQEPQVVPSPILDWTHETTRCATHLINTGTLANNPNCKIILSHGGGTLPFVAHRVANLSHMLGHTEMPPEDFINHCKKFYYDIALSGYKDQLRTLLDFAAPGHVLYGSDFPFVRENVVEPQLDQISEELATRSDMMSIHRGAALELFPRLATRVA